LDISAKKGGKFDWRETFLSNGKLFSAASIRRIGTPDGISDNISGHKKITQPILSPKA
jgi:hypothetical protein